VAVHVACSRNENTAFRRGVIVRRAFELIDWEWNNGHDYDYDW